MKVKYYMRGLGIGIILTTLIFTINGNVKKEKLSDNEIIARATDLGMVLQEKQNANDVLEDMKSTDEPSISPSPEPTITTEPSTTPEPTTTTEPSTTPEPTTTIEPSTTPEPTQVPEATKVPEITPKPTNVPEMTPEPTKTPIITGPTGNEAENHGEDIIFTIVGGMSSGKVAKLLNQVGLVDDADKFNNYIVKEGKADIIRVGTFTVHEGASYEEILDIITE